MELLRIHSQPNLCQIPPYFKLISFRALEISRLPPLKISGSWKKLCLYPLEISGSWKKPCLYPLEISMTLSPMCPYVYSIMRFLLFSWPTKCFFLNSPSPWFYQVRGQLWDFVLENLWGWGEAFWTYTRSVSAKLVVFKLKKRHPVW